MSALLIGATFGVLFQRDVRAGLAGGLVSSPVLLATGILPKIAGIDTSFVGVRGLLIHLLISALIGMSYGLLFRGEASSFGLGMAWGWLFGLIWWYFGPLTLLPLLLTGQIDWRPEAASALLPLLPGHLIYGATTLPSVRAPFYPMAASRPASRRTRTTPRSTRRDSGTGCLVVCFGTRSTTTHSARMTKATVQRHWRSPRLHHG